MIGEALIDLFFTTMRWAFAGLEFVQLPTQIIGTLETILVYGVWIVGVDIMALFCASVVAWWAIHMSIGLIVWIWERLPLT